MKKAPLIVSVFVGVVLFVAPVYAAAVRCPTPPRTQKKINYIFFSFFAQDATLGKHIPSTLVLIDPSYVKNGAPRCLTKQTYTAFKQLYTAAKSATGQTLIITSAWRSFETQQYFATTRPEFSAIPGRSEHQLGTTVDVHILEAKEDEAFGSTTMYAWMIMHAHEYGFVQSFSARDEAITGIPNEPWHWRFVGKTTATKVYKENLNINTYLFERNEAKKRAIR